MQRFTSLTAFEWIVVATFLCGAAVIGHALRRDVGLRRIVGLAMVPALVGGGMVLAVVAAQGDVLVRSLGATRRPAGVLVVAALAVAAASVVDVLLTRVVGWIESSRGLNGRRDLVTASVLLPVAVALISAVLVTGVLLDREGRVGGDAAAAVPTVPEPVDDVPTLDQPAVEPLELVSGLIHIATHDLPGLPLDVAVDAERGLGYVSLAHGEIVRSSVNSVHTDTLGGTVVAGGIHYPRGLAIVGDVLIVGELGALPCPHPVPRCKSEDVPEHLVDAEDYILRLIEAEELILQQSRGRVLAFDIDAQGDLHDQRVVLDRIPVVTSEHGVNGVALGSDGRVYVAIGHVDRLVRKERPLAGIDLANLEWLGTVLALDIEGRSPPEVFARGLRNVYGLAFSPDGALWGVDNDGLTLSTWRFEEVLMIREGEHYGYPEDGTFGPHAARSDDAVWISPRVGSAGIAWGGGAGLGDSLLIGSCGSLDILELTSADHGQWRVASRFHSRQLMVIKGCVTGIEVTGDLILVSVFEFGVEGVGSMIVLSSQAA